jgi:quinol monooxygenase YgiN
VPVVVVTAVFHPAPGRKEDLVEALRSTIPGVHEEDGCLLYAIHDAADGTITMIEKWASVADLDAHGSGPAVAALGAAIEGLVTGPALVTRMTPIPVGEPGVGEL